MTVLLLALLITQVAAAPQTGTADESAVEASAILDRSRQKLLDAPSLTMDIRIRARVDGRQIEAIGRHVAGPFPQARTELTTELSGLRATRIEVCDGQVLWQISRFTDTTVEPVIDPISGREQVDRTITRKDVDRVLAAIRTNGITTDQVLRAELGLGGLPAFLAGLDAAFDFRGQPGGGNSIILRGGWRDGVVASHGIDPKRSRQTLPDLAELTLDRKTLLPTRLTYYQTGDGEPQKIVQLDHLNIRVGDPVDARLFSYSPPTGATVEDTTARTLQEIEAAGRPESEPATD